MLSSDERIYVAVVITSAVMVLLVCVVLTAIVKYQVRLRKHLQEVSSLKSVYQEELFKAQLEVQEQTFLHISQEVHDNIGQILSLVRLNISNFKEGEIQGSSAKIETTKHLLDQAIEDLRQLSKRLNSDYVSQQSLWDSLRLQIGYLEKTGLYRLSYEVHGEEFSLNPDSKLIIFRITQEAINNVIKHAQASSISVILIYLADQIIVSIKDDGRGFMTNLPTANNGVGMQNMLHRAKLINAQLTIESEPGLGTLVQLIYPNPS